jgi:two-component system, sensor histidine kinase and response regulator
MTHILLIDDDKMHCELSRIWLERKGFQVSVAYDGLEGVRIALATLPDLIVCDADMPEMDGFTALAELRQYQEAATIPFIFLTARATRTAMRQGMDLGADDYLTKPSTRDELISAVESRLNRRDVIASSFQQEAKALQGKLARLVTHELRTPLINFEFVRQIINRQIEHLDQAQIKELLASLNSSSDRLTHIVDQMVYITQCDTGNLSAERLHTDGEPVAIDSILNSSIALGRRFAVSNKDMAIVVNRDSESAIITVGHSPSLKHMFAEIIANALNYSPEDSPVEIRVQSGDSTIEIRVIDNGCGMSAVQQRNALRSFEQIDRDQHEQQGLGLGLSLAKRIIEIHGGTLRIQSQQGQGTCVIVLLPALSQSA